MGDSCSASAPTRRPADAVDDLVHSVKNLVICWINIYRRAIAAERQVPLPDRTGPIILNRPVILRAADNQAWLSDCIGNVIELDIRNSFTEKAPMIAAIRRPKDSAIPKGVDYTGGHRVAGECVVVSMRTVLLNEASTAVVRTVKIHTTYINGCRLRRIRPDDLDVHLHACAKEPVVATIACAMYLETC